MTFLQWTWGLPQTLVGLAVVVIVRILDRRLTWAGGTTGNHPGTMLVRTTAVRGGVSLGYFLVVTDYRRRFGLPDPTVQDRLDAHEWGHSIQSLMFGPLYLLVIGVPSITRATYFRLTGPVTAERYFSAYPERWADRIAGVKR